MAERVGFEPTERFPVHSISSAASSTTPAPLRNESQISNLKAIDLKYAIFKTEILWRRGWAFEPHGCC